MFFPILLAAVITAGVVPAHAETWEPSGRASAAFTGKITFTPTRISFQSGASLPLAAAGTARLKADYGPTVTANVYKVTEPAPLPPYAGNMLCDGKKVAFILVWSGTGSDATLRHMEPFTGPHFATQSPDDCGRFPYFVAGGR